MKRWLSLINSWIAFILMIFLILLWEIGVRVFQIPAHILPLPSTVSKTFFQNFPLLWHHIQGTLAAASLGFVFAIVFSLVVSLILDRYGLLKRAFLPLFVVSQTIPIIALAPIIMIWFGLGFLPKVMIVVLVCFFPLVINLVEGLENVDVEYRELLLVMGASPYDLFRHLQWPSILPYFFSGLKIAATYSVMGAIIGEWLGGNLGLGVYMIRTMHTFHTANLFAAILAIVILSIGLFKIVEVIAWLVMPWQRTIKNKELR